MKKTLLIFSLITALMLAACDEKPKTEAQTPETNTEDQTTANNETTDNSEQATDNNKPNTDEQQSEVKSETISYVSNNKTETAVAEKTKSPQQDYTIELLQGFTLTAEEPGKDMLMYNDNPDTSMRIEVLDASELSFDELLTNTTDTVQAVASSKDYKEYNLTSTKLKDTIKNMHTFLVEFENDTVLTLLYETKGKFVRLTIFDNEADLKDAFVQMGLTIE